MRWRSTIYWCIWLATVFVAVGLCVHLASGQPTPPRPRMKAKRIVPPTQGAGALALISKLKSVVAVPVVRTNLITWQYPSNIVPSNYWWNVMERKWSSGWSAWAVAISNSTDGNDTVFVNKTNPQTQWRLQGRLVR